MAELEVFSEDVDVDTDSEFEDEEKLIPEDKDDDRASAGSQSASCLSGLCIRSCCCPGARMDLSVQSGDITRSAPSTEPASSSLHNFFFRAIHFIVRIVCFQINTPVIPISIVSPFLLVGVVCGVLLMCFMVFTRYPPSINTSLRSFTIPDHPTTEHWDAFQAATNGDIENETSATSPTDGSDLYGQSSRSWTQTARLRTLPSLKGWANGLDNPPQAGVVKRGLSSAQFTDCPQNYYTQRYITPSWIMDIVFKAKRGTNILDEKQIRYIHSIEEHIHGHELYPYFCHLSGSSYICDPLNSLLTYLYPRNTDDGSYIYPKNGGFVPNYMNVTLPYLVDKVPATLFYTGGQVQDLKASLLRAQVQVGVPLRCYSSYDDGTDRQEEKVLQFFLKLVDYLDHASSKEVEVLYGGTLIFDYEVEQAIYHDAMLAGVSLVLILCLMFVLTGFSPFTTMAGLFAIATSFPLAYTLYRAFQFESVGILNVISPFVIIGIGVDDVFVYLNTFKQSQRFSGLDTIHKRLTHTIMTAGTATFFTSATTAVAFGANGLSQIPAVKQFGVFMFLVVSCCYLSVSIIMPLYLHVYYCYLCPLENLIYYPVVFLLRWVKKKTPPCPQLSSLCQCCRTGPRYATALSVRMRDIADDDSGIDEGNGSVDSTSDNSSSDSDPSLALTTDDRPLGESPEAVVVLDTSEPQVAEDDRLLLLGTREQPRAGAMPIGVGPQTAEYKLTSAVQVFMLKFVARPIMFLQTIEIHNRLQRLVARLALLSVFVVICSISVGGMFQLRFTNHQPQLFDPDSNIQKMLDLAGNLSDLDTASCYQCSAWNPGGTVPPYTPPTTVTTRPTTPPPHTTASSATTSTPTSAATTATTATTPTSATTDTDPTDPPTDPTDPPTDPTDPPTDPTDPPTDPTDPTDPPTDPTGPTDPPTDPTPTTASPHTKVSTKYTNNVVVYAVFGIKDITRKYSTSHVLPTEGEGDLAVLDPAFKSSFTCPRTSTVMAGTVNALCRFCKNITDPQNGLVQNHNAQCFPSSSSFSFNRFLQCLGVPDFLSLPDCQEVELPDSSEVSFQAEYGIESSSSSNTLTFLAMAFGSTTFEGSSPFDGYKDYQKWEDFFQSEMKEIEKLSGPGQPYEGAYDILSSGFQTSKFWVEVNTQIIAILGGIYGILCSLILCSLLVVLLSHNWRVVVSMFVTIGGILVTLLALFVAFGWELGIVEAISLSILVGNSVDYCIHLSEGYMAADTKYMAFVESFKFTQSASIRVKRVMSAISFIGVSILSSAITTIIATVPLLATQIQLFARFGQILLLDTLIAILYTLVFCSSFLGLIGPRNSKFKLLNAVLTITAALASYGAIFLILYLLSQATEIFPGPKLIFSPPTSF